jgi:hypothetical protein
MAVSPSEISSSSIDRNNDAPLMRLWIRGLAHSSFAKKYCSSLRVSLKQSGQSSLHTTTSSPSDDNNSWLPLLDRVPSIATLFQQCRQIDDDRRSIYETSSWQSTLLRVTALTWTTCSSTPSSWTPEAPEPRYQWPNWSQNNLPDPLPLPCISPVPPLSPDALTNSTSSAINTPNTTASPTPTPATSATQTLSPQLLRFLTHLHSGMNDQCTKLEEDEEDASTLNNGSGVDSGNIASGPLHTGFVRSMFGLGYCRAIEGIPSSFASMLPVLFPLLFHFVDNSLLLRVAFVRWCSSH